MNTDRIHPQFAEAREAVVTYSHVPPRKRAGGRAVVERVEPRLDAAEVPLIDPHDDVDPAFAVPQPELRADPVDATLAGKGRRGGSMSVVVLGAAFAILAGLGVLAGTIGVATIIPGGARVDEAPLRLTSAEAVSEIPAEPAAVREIPLVAGEEAPAAEAVAIEPPLPRPRPEAEAASLAPDAATPLPPVEGDTAAKAPEPRPAGSGGSEPAARATPSDPQPRNTDALITSIEQTLEKIDSAPASAETGAATAGAEAAQPPMLLPPPSLDPLAAAPPSVYPPLHDDCPPPSAGFEPCYDVMPPEPLTDNGYYQAGPVPPEPVPYPYPPAGSDGPGTFADGSASLVGEPEPETERRPGFVRRAITRTADAVGRVFSRDRDSD